MSAETPAEQARLYGREREVAAVHRMLSRGQEHGLACVIRGDPGIGKSTLLLQVLSILGTSCNAIYVSGEESVQQIALRARRLAVDAAGLNLMAENSWGRKQFW